MSAQTGGPRYRPLAFGVTRVVVRGSDGHTYARADQTLGEHVPRITDRLTHWATWRRSGAVPGPPHAERRWQPRRLARRYLRRGGGRRPQHRRALLDAGASVSARWPSCRKQHRARAARAGRDVRRRAVLPGVDAIRWSARILKTAPRARHHHAGRGLRRRSRALRSRHQRHRRGRRAGSS